MAYTEKEARELVIKAGLMLIEKKLTARTWGNISARISDEEFIVTPSGRAYEEITEADLVRVRISDCSYIGNIKPSGERGVHAVSYALRPEVNFIIHTHQLYASAVSAEEKSVPFAPCAKYGLPGSDSLKESVKMCVAIHPEDKCFLMAKHGTLILGESFEEAFTLADELEEKCKALFLEKRNPCSKSKYKKAWIDDYAQMIGFGIKKETDDLEAVLMISEKNRAAAEFVKDAKPLSLPDWAVQRAVYRLKYSRMNETNK